MQSPLENLQIKQKIDEEKSYWPIFKEPTENGKKFKFWKKDKCDITEDDIIISENLIRLGKNKPTPKEYYYTITKDGRLIYQVKKNKKIKGWI